LLGDVLSAQGEWQAADQAFEQALQQFSSYRMHLEYARTQHRYGRTILLRETRGSTHYQQGLVHLREARSWFIECQAALDLQRIDSDLMALSDTPTPEHAL